MTHVTCRLTAKNRDQLRNRVISSVIEYGLLLPLLYDCVSLQIYNSALQVCDQPRTAAVNVTLLAFSAAPPLLLLGTRRCR